MAHTKNLTIIIAIVGVALVGLMALYFGNPVNFLTLISTGGQNKPIYGGGVSGQAAFWTGSTTLGGLTNLTYYKDSSNIENLSFVGQIKASSFCINNDCRSQLWPAGTLTPEQAACSNVVIGTGGGGNGYGDISLIKSNDGQNICSDMSGCTIKVVRFSTTQLGGIDSFREYPIIYRQQSSNEAWYFAAGNKTGINGDSVETKLINNWYGLTISDDKPGEASGAFYASKLSYSKGLSSYGFMISVCDF